MQLNGSHVAWVGDRKREAFDSGIYHDILDHDKKKWAGIKQKGAGIKKKSGLELNILGWN